MGYSRPWVGQRLPAPTAVPLERGQNGGKWGTENDGRIHRPSPRSRANVAARAPWDRASRCCARPARRSREGSGEIIRLLVGAVDWKRRSDYEIDPPDRRACAPRLS